MPDSASSPVDILSAFIGCQISIQRAFPQSDGYTYDWLAGMVSREGIALLVGGRYVYDGCVSVTQIWRGDQKLYQSPLHPES